MKILFAEDDAEAAAYVVRGLSGEGHVVDHLTDGKDALSQAMSGEYDLLILDRMMPGLDGLSVLNIPARRESRYPGDPAKRDGRGGRSCCGPSRWR